MTTIQKIGKLFIFALLIAGLFSCDDDDDLGEFNYFGDVILAKRSVNDTTAYACMYYAYGNRTISSASVELPDGTTVSLSASSYSSTTFYDLPDISEYSTTSPDLGEYSFTIENEGIEYTTTDTLETSSLEIPVIDSVSYSAEEVYVEWELPDDDEPDSYLVRMVDDDYETVFVGVLMNNTVYAYTISSASGTFSQTPVDGETYMVEVQAFQYEDDASSSNYLYNVNNMAIASTEVTWGE